MKLLLAILLLAGCAGPQWCKTVTIPAQEIAVCGPGTIGQSGKYGNWIIVPGWMTDRGIEVDNEMLGHEIRHQLNRQDSEFRNPDK